ncbi:MAG: hypothetical protein FWF29_00425, partial [Treponema sp.]|nr:hypothetical protein [Treponema sp.]
MGNGKTGPMLILVFMVALLCAGCPAGAGSGGNVQQPVHNIVIIQPESGGSFTVGVGSNSLVSGNATVTAAAGEIVSLTGTAPASGYKFTSFVLTGGELNDDGIRSRTFNMPDNDVTVTALYEAVAYTITVVQPVTGGGSVSVAVDNGTPGAENTTAFAGMSVALSASPDTANGYRFVAFSLNGAVLDDGSGPDRTFVMPANNVTVGAIFEQGVLELADKDVFYSKGAKEICQSWETSIVLVPEKNYEITFQYRTSVQNAMNIYLCRGRWWPDGLESGQLITAGNYADSTGLLQMYNSGTSTPFQLLRFPDTGGEWVTRKIAFTFTYKLCYDLGGFSDERRLGICIYTGTHQENDTESEVWVNYLGMRELNDDMEPVGPNLVVNSDFTAG